MQNPPEYGSGPVNYANQGQDGPFGAFDNTINYNEMMRQQVISQYQQNTVNPASMTMSNFRRVATDPRMQYGARQNAALYNRQAELSRGSYAAGVAGGMVDMGLFGVAETAAGIAGLSGMNFGGMLAMKGAAWAGFGAVMAAPLVPMHFINKGMQGALERTRFMHSMAADVEAYKDKIGLSGMTYNEASRLGGRLATSMSSGGFFDQEQQSRIHKIGLSNDLLTAKTRSFGKGSIAQYEKNVKELISTTEDVVKLLNTTIEGGMSVIKELKQNGFGSMQSIRQQVIQAKAFGNLTGLGTQNMMALGAAGAQAVQGTPWSAQGGANMYQMGAVMASNVASGGASGNMAVNRVGGVAAAGGIAANFAMNLMSSGIGTKIAGYLGDFNGKDYSVNKDRMDRLLTGKASAFEVTSGAGGLGARIGSARARFGFFKEDLGNMMAENPEMAMRVARKGFELWASQRPYAGFDDQRAAFTKLYSQNSREQRFLYEMLGSNPDFGGQQIARNIEGMSLSATYQPRRLGRVGRAISGAYKSVTDPLVNFGESAYYGMSDALASATNARTGFAAGLSRGYENLLVGIGIYGEEGRNDRGTLADARDARRRAMGIGFTPSRDISTAQFRAGTITTFGDISSGGKRYDMAAVRDRVGGDWTQLIQGLRTAYDQGTPANLQDIPLFKKGFGTDVWSLKDIKNVAASLDQAQTLNTRSMMSSEQMIRSEANYEKSLSRLSAAKQVESNVRLSALIRGGDLESISSLIDGSESYQKKRALRERLGGATLPELKRARDILTNKTAYEAAGSFDMMGGYYVDVSGAREELKKVTNQTIREERGVSYFSTSGKEFKYTQHTSALGKYKKTARRAGIDVNKEGWDTQLAAMLPGIIEKIDAGRNDPSIKLTPAEESIINTSGMEAYARANLGSLNKLRTAQDAVENAMEAGGRLAVVNRYMISAKNMAFNKKGTSIQGFGELLKKVAIGQVSDKDVESLKGDYNSQTRELLGFTGKEEITGKSLQEKLLNYDPQTSIMNTPTDVNLAKSLLSKEMVKLTEERNKEFNKESDVVKAENKEERDKKIDARLEVIKAKREELSDIANLMGEGRSTGNGGLTTAARSPVLNYWNNRWVL